ncbi:MAG: hypothetical protein AAGF93_09245 [Cyanobacteria bacterium P01_H01_bin.105]
MSVDRPLRVHMSEWSIGAAAGVTASWLVDQSELSASEIVEQSYIKGL